MSRVRITESQLRRIIREELLREKAVEMPVVGPTDVLKYLQKKTLPEDLRTWWQKNMALMPKARSAASTALDSISAWTDSSVKIPPDKKQEVIGMILDALDSKKIDTREVEKYLSDENNLKAMINKLAGERSKLAASYARGG